MESSCSCRRPGGCFCVQRRPEFANSRFVVGMPLAGLASSVFAVRKWTISRSAAAGGGPASANEQQEKPSFSPWIKRWSGKEELLIVDDTSEIKPYKWEGWGTSLCWWANFVGGLPAEEMKQVLDLLFDPHKGLGLNIVRYNIGGGANPISDTNMRLFADMPGFRPGGLSGPYIWTADERQQQILLGAKARGANIFEAFSNSPPWWMTISGSATGNKGRGQDNLDPRYYDAFAEYLVDVVKHYNDEVGLQFDYLAPFNEPAEGWWNIDRKKKAQEGCNFSASSLYQVTLKVKRALQQKGLSTKVSAFDAWSCNTPKLLRSLSQDVADAIDQINVHTYVHFVQREEFAKRQEVRQAVASLGKKLWMSEYGPLNWNGDEWTVALAVSRHITLDLNRLQPAAWCYWQVVETPGTHWGLIHAAFSYEPSPTVQIRKQYYVLQQFTRFIRPGFNILPNENKFSNVLVAATDEAGKRLVLVVTNSSATTNMDVSYKLTGCVPQITSKAFQATVYRTSSTEDMVELPGLVFPAGTERVSVWTPPKSVSTIIVHC